jgi:hypothetical protein
MIEAVKTFLSEILQGLVLADGATHPFRPADPDVPGDLGTLFFSELPRDYLKDNAYAAQCLPLQDRKKPEGRRIARTRNGSATAYTFIRRRYRREVLFRCFLYAEGLEELWGPSGYTGLVDQFEQAIAATRVFADSGNNAVRIELHDAARPWNSEAENDRKRRRPHLAIVRVQFTGGIHTTEVVPIIQDAEITPLIQ